MLTMERNDLAELLEQVRRGYCLPQPFYTDERIHAEDLKRIYQRQWLYAGHVSRVKNPGDFFTYQVGEDSIIVARSKDGEIYASFNVCTHRGSRICLKECGHANQFVCPYHQWVFGQDGTLLTARNMPEHFDKSEYGLRRLHTRVLEGLIFICFAPEPPDFGPIARDFGLLVGPHGLPDAKICCVKHYDLASNWKLVIENSRECYHCHFGHPEYASLMMSRPNDTAHVKECILHIEERTAHYRKLGLYQGRNRHDGYAISRYPLMRKGAVSESRTGGAVAPIMGSFKDRDAGVLGGYIFPNFMIEASSDYVVTFRFTPVSAKRTAIEATWYVHPDAVEGKDYDVNEVIWFWKTTGEQDWKLCEDNQLGVNSSAYRPGPYAPEEGGEDNGFANWYAGQMRKEA